MMQYMPLITLATCGFCTFLFMLSRDYLKERARRVRFEYNRRALMDSAWIDYKKNPPTDITQYIIITNGNHLGIVRYGEDRCTIYKDNDCEWRPEITHWMPLSTAFNLLSHPKDK